MGAEGGGEAAQIAEDGNGGDGATLQLDGGGHGSRAAEALGEGLLVVDGEAQIFADLFEGEEHFLEACL